MLVSGCENVAANSLMEYLHREDAFDALMVAFPSSVEDVSPGAVFCAFVVAGLIANYQKYETRNLFVARLAAAPEAVTSAVARIATKVLMHARIGIRVGDAPSTEKAGKKEKNKCCFFQRLTKQK